MADYCTKCGSYRSETALEQCVCDAIICAICMVNEPIHMKHQRDHERRERAKIVIAKDAEIKRLRQSLRSVRMLAARMQRSGVEMLRIEANGEFYVKGRFTAVDLDVYQAFKAWLNQMGD